MLQTRQDEGMDEFVVDDNGLGYVDMGQDEWTKEYHSDEDEKDPSSNNITC